MLIQIIYLLVNNIFFKISLAKCKSFYFDTMQYVFKTHTHSATHAHTNRVNFTTVSIVTAMDRSLFIESADFKYSRRFGYTLVVQRIRLPDVPVVLARCQRLLDSSTSHELPVC